VILVEKPLLQTLQHTKTTPTWVRVYDDKRGPPYIEQEDIITRVDKFTGIAHTNLPEELKAIHGCLHFTEQQISLCLNCQKFTLKIIRNISQISNKPELGAFLCAKDD
jgi:hypothetical protein